jgi:hypothetical protein
MIRNKIYLLLSGACLIGYSWIALNYFEPAFTDNAYFNGCLIKTITGIPCPSCGTTRAVLALSRGEFLNSIMLNPFGLIVLLILLISPVWILADLMRKEETLALSYRYMERILLRPRFAIPAIAIVLCNWIWNIYKGL